MFEESTSGISTIASDDIPIPLAQHLDDPDPDELLPMPFTPDMSHLNTSSSHSALSASTSLDEQSRAWDAAGSRQQISRSALGSPVCLTSRGKSGDVVGLSDKENQASRMEERESVEGREKCRSVTPGESLDLRSGSYADSSVPRDESTQLVRRDSPQTIISTPIRRYLAGKSTMGAPTSSGAEWDPNVTPASRDRAHQGQSVSRCPLVIRTFAHPGRP